MIQQGTPEWYKERSGRLTASEFSCVLAKPTTKKYINYQRSVIDELLNIPDFERGIPKPWFAHGKEMEAEAVGSYAFKKNVEVSDGGFFVHPDYDYIAASPDGLIGLDGGCEAKGRKSLTEHEKSEKAGIDKKYLPQVQGNLWTTGRKWWDFISYYKSDPDKKTKQIKTLLHVHRVYPDKEYIAMLETACLKFWKDIEDKLNNRNSEIPNNL